jgi:Ca2+-binding RTX toxin-like protein/subtilisin-like proprotein convertase family protein
MATLPNDLLFQQQWYLNNTGTNSNGGTAGIDLNIVDDKTDNYDVWDDYTGLGITVGIIDDGVESAHEDLQANYNSAPTGLTGYDPASGQPQAADDSHGTAVAGIIAGVANNQVGISGVAYNARITGFRYADITDTDASVLSNQQFFDVSNNSWGIDNPFQTNFKLPAGQVAQQAIQEAVTKGRGGLGTVFAWAGGNEFENGANANYGNYENSRYTIAVSAVDADGVFAPYSVQGANLLVSAFGDGDPTNNLDGTIVTTDRMAENGYNPPGTPPAAPNQPELDSVNYTNKFNGTSSATPMVSGVVALMLEANRELGYRDVQEILAYSAIQNDPIEDNQNDWRFNAATNWNGGGLHNNHNYGFGLVDAHAAVRMAETWTMQSTAADSTAGTPEVMVENGPTAAVVQPIPDGDPNGLSTTLNIESGLKIDQIEVDLNIEHTAIEELYITLLSPDGTESILFNGPELTGNIDPNDPNSPPKQLISTENGKVAFADFRTNPSQYTQDPTEQALGASYQQGINFTFGSTFYWGETGAGDWTLNVEDRGTAGTGSLNSRGLRLYGDTISPSDTYIYTDEFATVAGSDTMRATLTDAGGMDTINAAAITTGITLDLTPGSTGNTLAGAALAIEAGTTIESAFGGDGNDTITGNDANNMIFGGRGADSLMGGAGDDTIVGGKGANTLMGGVGADLYVLTSKNGGTFIQDEDGAADSLVFSDDSVTGFSAAPAKNQTLSLEFTKGMMGVARQGTNLVIDLDANGAVEAANDLTIANFFTEADTTAGAGFIENVGNLSADQLLALVDIEPSTTGPGTETMAGGQFTIADMKMAEGNDTIAQMTFTVSLAKAATEAVTVSYMTKDGTAIGISAPDAKLFTAELTGAQEVPAIESKAKGMAMAELNAAKNALDYSVTVEGLDFTTLTGGQALTPDTLDFVKGLHIHAGKMGQKGGAVFDILQDLASDTLDTTLTKNQDGTVTIKGKWEADDTLAASQPLSDFTSLIGGESGSDTGLYVNVHTNANPDGEIRGQLLAKAADFVNTSGELTLAAGQTEQTVTVGVIGDMMVEGDETFTVSLMDAKGMEVAKAATGTITNDDSLAAATEGDDTLTGGEMDDSIDGLGGDDAIKGGAGNDTLVGGAGSDMLDGGPGDDSLVGGDGNDTLMAMTGADTLDGGAGDDSLVGSSKGMLIGGAGSDTYVLDSMTAAGTAIEDSEGDADSLTLTGITLSVDATLPAGAVGLQRQGTNLAIDINADGVFDETDLTVENFFAANDTVAGTGYIETVGNLTGEEILAGVTEAQPPAAMVELSIDSVSAAEGTGTLTFTVSLSEPSTEEVTVDYTTIDDTIEGAVEGAATVGTDYEAASGTLTFAAGETAQTITVSLIDDADVEPDETLTVSLSGAMGAEITMDEATGTIADDDTLIGGTDGDETYPAPKGSATFTGSKGSDMIIGAVGFLSQVSYFSLTIGVFVNLLEGIVLKGDNGQSGTDTLEGIQVIEGSNQADTIVGSNSETAGENLMGNLGADSLDGGEGNDTLDGGMPADATELEQDRDTIAAGVGDDVVMGCLGGDSIDGGEGADLITYMKSTASVTINVTASTVVVTGFGTDNFTGIEVLEGSNFGDTLIGGGEGVTVTLKGGKGGDSLKGGAGEVTLDGGEGDDTLTGGTGKGMLEGGKGNDSLVAGVGSETLMGGGGNDTYALDTLTGAGTVIEDSEGDGDSLTGFSLDAASLTLAAGVIGVQRVETTLQIDLNASGTFETATDLSVLNFFSATGTAGAGYIEFVGGIQGSQILDLVAGTDTAGGGEDTTGGGQDTTGGGQDTAGGGQDTAGGGQDTTGGGQDTTGGGVVVPPAVLPAESPAPSPTPTSTPTGDTLTGTDAADSLAGGTGNDALSGGAGNDALSGEDGDDDITGGDGDDSLSGGTGNDTCAGGAGNDSLSGEEGTDSLDGGDGGDSLNGGAGNDTCVGGMGNDSLSGEADSDAINGNEDADTVSGGTGNDLLNGNQGSDMVEGGTGNDICQGGKDNDTVMGDEGNDVVLGNLGDDQVDGGDETDFIHGNQGRDMLKGGTGNDICRGGKDNDTVIGGVGGDAIMGDNGDDMLIGADMNSATAGMGEMDALTGGAGFDTFIIGEKGKRFYEGDGTGGMAVIRDFNASEDKIQLSGSISSYSMQVEISTSTTIITTSDGDVICRLENTTNFSLSASYISFVG